MEDDDNASPLIKTEECTFAYIKHSNVYIVATTRKNSNIVMLFTLLHRICQAMQEYFKEVGEESIRDNFVIGYYELMDELIAFGILQEYIRQVINAHVSKDLIVCFYSAPNIPPAVTMLSLEGLMVQEQ